ncbi:MAG: hypothetical protein ACLQDY_19225 [Streptosporangiaceae bacterium]
MQVIEAQRASILVPHDHLHNKHERALACGLGGMAYASSVEYPLNDQRLVRPLVAAAGETVFMSDSGGEVWLRPSDIGAVALAVPTAPDWRVSPGLHVLPGTTSWAVTAAGRS